MSPEMAKCKLERLSATRRCACGVREFADRVRCKGIPEVRRQYQFSDDVHDLITCDMECLVCGHVQKLGVMVEIPSQTTRQGVDQHE